MSGLDDMYGPGADAADAEAGFIEDIINDVFADVGMPRNDDEEIYATELMLKAIQLYQERTTEEEKEWLRAQLEP